MTEWAEGLRKRILELEAELGEARNLAEAMATSLREMLAHVEGLGTNWGTTRTLGVIQRADAAMGGWHHYFTTNHDGKRVRAWRQIGATPDCGQCGHPIDLADQRGECGYHDADGPCLCAREHQHKPDSTAQRFAAATDTLGAKEIEP